MIPSESDNLVIIHHAGGERFFYSCPFERADELLGYILLQARMGVISRRASVALCYRLGQERQAHQRRGATGA